MTLLEASEIAHQLSNYPDWQLNEKALCRVFDFHTFSQAIDFVNQIAKFSERVGHHPEIDIRYSKVKLSLVTKDQGGITQQDFDWIRDWSAQNDG